jgi:putative transposase
MLRASCLFMYPWRRLTDEQRKEVLAFRIQQQRPWHSPPTLFTEGQFHIAAACYEHASHIGYSPERMANFSQRFLTTLESQQVTVFAWCVLPNHYHLLAATDNLRAVKKELGRLHGRSSREWNLAEATTGRTVWHNCTDRAMRSERHFWATMNYIHNNPVHHGYVQRWDEWAYSSAREYLATLGREQAKEIWQQYPLMDFGKGWDDPST